MGKSGVITIESKDNQVYHDVAVLFKIYRSVSWRMQVQIPLKKDYPLFS